MMIRTILMATTAIAAFSFTPAALAQEESSVDCSNCFNESYIQSSLSSYSYLNRPMEWTVRAKYRF